jgi:hypothetical protein
MVAAHVDPIPAADGITLVVSGSNTAPVTRLYLPGGGVTEDAATVYFVTAVVSIRHRVIIQNAGKHTLATVKYTGTPKTGAAKRYGTIEFVGKDKIPIEEWLRAREGDKFEVTIEGEDYVWARAGEKGACVNAFLVCVNVRN